MDDKHINIKDCDWQLIIQNGETIPNLTINRKNGKNFHATMVEDFVFDNDGEKINFRQLIIIEHEQAHDKVGDVVIQFRIHPTTKRYVIQVEQENVFETETIIKQIWRATRSSVDNTVQSVKKTVAHTGWLYANPRRMGGKPIKTHYIIAGWSPQVSGQMMDVYDYIQTHDSLGLATLLKALQVMPDKPARAIFNQMRMPAN